jgi:hypothetical protein
MMVQPNPIALDSSARKIDLARPSKNYSAGPNTASILAFSVAALNGLTM